MINIVGGSTQGNAQERPLQLHVGPEHTVGQLKDMVSAAGGPPAEQQRLELAGVGGAHYEVILPALGDDPPRTLAFAAQSLENPERTLGEYGVAAGSTLRLASRSVWELPVSEARVDMVGVSPVFDPENKGRQQHLCDHVSTWAQNLAQTVSELLVWKDDAFEANCLPLNMLSQLAVITSRLVREKGEMMPTLHKALGMTRSFINNEVKDEEVEALKAYIRQQENLLEMEKMRRIESERKVTACLSQVQHLRADQKMQRWSRLYSARRMLQQERVSAKRIKDLRSHNELLLEMVKKLRDQLSAESGGVEAAFDMTTLVPPAQTKLGLEMEEFFEDMGDQPRPSASGQSARHTVSPVGSASSARRSSRPATADDMPAANLAAPVLGQQESGLASSDGPNPVSYGGVEQAWARTVTTQEVKSDEAEAAAAVAATAADKQSQLMRELEEQAHAASVTAEAARREQQQTLAAAEAEKQAVVVLYEEQQEKLQAVSRRAQRLASETAAKDAELRSAQSTLAAQRSELERQMATKLEELSREHAARKQRMEEEAQQKMRQQQEEASAAMAALEAKLATMESEREAAVVAAAAEPEPVAATAEQTPAKAPLGDEVQADLTVAAPVEAQLQAAGAGAHETGGLLTPGAQPLAETEQPSSDLVTEAAVAAAVSTAVAQVLAEDAAVASDATPGSSDITLSAVAVESEAVPAAVSAAAGVEVAGERQQQHDANGQHDADALEAARAALAAQRAQLEAQMAAKLEELTRENAERQRLVEAEAAEEAQRQRQEAVAAVASVERQLTTLQSEKQAMVAQLTEEEEAKAAAIEHMRSVQDELAAAQSAMVQKEAAAQSKLAEELERSQARQRHTTQQMEELRRSMEATEAATAEVEAAAVQHERPNTAPRPSTRGSSSDRASSRAESLFGLTDASFGVPVRQPPPDPPPPGSPGNKQSYSRDEYVQAKLLHAKQLHFVSEMYQKRIARLERRVMHLAGKHVRLRGPIDKSHSARAVPRPRRSFTGHVVSMTPGTSTSGPSGVSAGGAATAAHHSSSQSQSLEDLRQGAVDQEVASAAARGGAQQAAAVAEKVFMPATGQGMVPKPPSTQSARLRAKTYTPRAAYVHAKDALTAREVAMVKGDTPLRTGGGSNQPALRHRGGNKHGGGGSRLPKIPTPRTVNLFAQSRVL